MDQAGLSEQMTYSAQLSHDDDFPKAWHLTFLTDGYLNINGISPF